MNLYTKKKGGDKFHRLTKFSNFQYLVPFQRINVTCKSEMYRFFGRIWRVIRTSWCTKRKEKVINSPFYR